MRVQEPLGGARRTLDVTTTEATWFGADRAIATGRRRYAGGRQDDRRGMPGLGDQRTDVPPLSQPGVAVLQVVLGRPLKLCGVFGAARSRPDTT